MWWSHSDEQALGYLRLLSRENALTPQLLKQKEALESLFTSLTGERFPSTVRGRIAASLEDDYSLYHRRRAEEDS